MIDHYNKYGHKVFMKWMDILGYEQIEGALISERSRTFMLTVHSDSKVGLTVNDTLTNDLEFKSNEMIIRRFGKIFLEEGPLVVL